MFLIYWIFSILFSNKLLGYLSSSHLANNSILLKPEHQDFSLSRGFVYSESEVLKNILKYGKLLPETQNIEPIVDHLFFSPDGVGIAVSNGAYKIGTYLDTDKIVKLLKFTKDRDLAGVAEIKTFLLSKNIPSNKVNKFFTALQIESFRPSTREVLLSFLWKKLNSREEMLEYYKLLSAESLSSYGMSVTREPLQTEIWLKYSFGKETYFTLSKSFKEIKVAEELYANFNSLDKDLQLFLLKGYNLFETKVPPILSYQSVKLPSDSGENLSYADCVETAIRFLVGALIYKDGFFDSEKLSSARENLKSFFASGYNTIYAQDCIFHNSWSEVVTDILEYPEAYKNISESGKKYEIKSNLSNFFNILKYILFENLSDVPVQRDLLLNKICEKFSSEGQLWSWSSPSSTFESDIFGDVVFNLNNLACFKLSIQSGHAKIIPIFEEEDWRPLLLDLFVKNNNFDEISILSNLQNSLEIWKHTDNEAAQKAALMTSPLSLQEYRNLIIPELVKPSNLFALSITTCLIKKTDADDFAAWNIYGEALLEHNPAMFHVVESLCLPKLFETFGHSRKTKFLLAKQLIESSQLHLFNHLLISGFLTPDELQGTIEIESGDSTNELSIYSAFWSLDSNLTKKSKQYLLLKKLLELGCSPNLPWYKSSFLTIYFSGDQLLNSPLFFKLLLDSGFNLNRPLQTYGSDKPSVLALLLRASEHSDDFLPNLTESFKMIQSAAYKANAEDLCQIMLKILKSEGKQAEFFKYILTECIKTAEKENISSSFAQIEIIDGKEAEFEWIRESILPFL